MRENKRPKASIPVRFRENSAEGCPGSSKQTITKPSKSKDLRSKLNKQRKLEKAKPTKEKNSSHLSSDDLDESNFDPDYEGEPIDVSEPITSSDQDQTDENNNAQKVKSVVITSSAQNSSKNSRAVRQKVFVSGESEAEEGEISVSDNVEDGSSFFDNPNDQQLAEFLQKHRDRIKKVTSNDKKERDDSGKPDHLSENIRRMSLMDRQSNQPVHNSQSEDTIYSRLV